MRLTPRKITATAPTPTDTPSSTSSDTHTLTADQWADLCQLAALDPADATIEEVITTLGTLIDDANTGAVAAAAAAAAGPAPVLIDGEVWAQMETSIKLGLKSMTDKERARQEQIVNAAIRHGKIPASQQQKWIDAYRADPEDTLSKFSRMPTGKYGDQYFEIGHNRSTEDLNASGWVTG